MASLVARITTDSSTLGIVRGLVGVTLLRPATKCVCVVPEVFHMLHTRGTIHCRTYAIGVRPLCLSRTRTNVECECVARLEAQSTAQKVPSVC